MWKLLAPPSIVFTLGGGARGSVNNSQGAGLKHTFSFWGRGGCQYLVKPSFARGLALVLIPVGPELALGLADLSNSMHVSAFGTSAPDL